MIKRSAQIVLFSVSTLLGACSTQPPSTPYEPAPQGSGRFGYRSEALGGQLYFVEFMGSAKTPARTAEAFAFFHAAELAKSLNMPAFTVEQGPIDRSVLEGEEVFSFGESIQVPELQSQEVAADQPRRIKTSTVSIPIYIRIESPEAVYKRTAAKLVILRVRMHETLPNAEDPRTFITDDVLQRLGPRIVRAQPT